ncbi:MAG TPA: TetR/AcrR family transcriptional regulator [candidate division Zixibacteria bacterium]|nr:TetR/AcrR family transcriptional regulator [candidate division Zixibacteria bacterium]
MDKKPHIISCAQILFAQFGLKKVTMDDIAREAHVSKATLYKHFKNKSSIFDTVVQGEIDSLVQIIRDSVNAQSGARGKLRAHLSTRLGKVGEFVNFYRVTQESWGEYWPHFARIRNAFVKREHDLVLGILRGGIEMGELEIDNPDMAAWALVLALASVEYQWASIEGEFSLNEMVDMMIDMIFNGIGVRHND